MTETNRSCSKTEDAYTFDELALLWSLQEETSAAGGPFLRSNYWGVNGEKVVNVLLQVADNERTRVRFLTHVCENSSDKQGVRGFINWVQQSTWWDDEVILTTIVDTLKLLNIQGNFEYLVTKGKFNALPKSIKKDIVYTSDMPTLYYVSNWYCEGGNVEGYKPLHLLEIRRWLVDIFLLQVEKVDLPDPFSQPPPVIVPANIVPSVEVEKLSTHPSPTVRAHLAWSYNLTRESSQQLIKPSMSRSPFPHRREGEEGKKVVVKHCVYRVPVRYLPYRTWKRVIRKWGKDPDVAEAFRLAFFNKPALYEPFLSHDDFIKFKKIKTLLTQQGV